jgi:hypothetical protein
MAFQNPWDLLGALPPTDAAPTSSPSTPNPFSTDRIAVPRAPRAPTVPVTTPTKTTPPPVFTPTPPPAGTPPVPPVIPAPGAGAKPGGLPPGYKSPNPLAVADVPAYFQLIRDTRNLPPTSASLDELLAVLEWRGINAKRATHAGGLPSDDKIILPDGTMIDTIQDVGGPGARWMWSVVGDDGGGSPSGTGVPGLPIQPFGPQFDDPSTKYLEDFLKGRLAELNAPVNDPARDQLAKLLDEQITRYGGFLSEQQGTNDALKKRQAAANTSADEYIAYLRQNASELQKLPPEIQQAYEQLVQGTNQRITDLSQLPPQFQQALATYRQGTSTRLSDLQNLPPDLAQALQEYVTQTEGRMTQLRAPAYTGAEQEILRTQALDPIENDRQAAKQRDLARIGNSGMLPSSGIALALQNATDQSYDRQRNTAQGELAYKQIQERRDRDAEIQRLAESLFGTKAGVSAVGEDRKKQAQDLLQLLTETEKGTVAFQDSRGAEAQGLRSTLLDAATGKSNLDASRKLKAGELLGSIPGVQREGVASDLALSNEMQAAIERITQGQIAASGQRVGLNEQVRGDEATRRQEALTLASILQQLPTAAMQQAMAAIGQAPNPESMINQLITLFGIGQTTRNQNANYYAQLGQALPYLASSFKPQAKGVSQLPGSGQPLM